MHVRTKTNGILFVLMLSIPLIAELITATPDNVPGTGFSILLYEPFDFAYCLLTFVLLLFANISISKAHHSPLWESVMFSVVLFILWFVVSFVTVLQLHQNLGGTL